MASQAMGRFALLVGYVDQLIQIHGRIQAGQGRRHQQDSLHRAGIVLMVAAWESYIETILIEALTAVENAGGFAPTAVGPEAAPNWAKHMFSLRKVEVQRGIKKFNTPDATGVRDLFKATFDFDPSGLWLWQAHRRDWNNQVMRARLNDWLVIRHCVAHGGDLPTSITWIQGAGGRPRLTLNELRECRRFFEHVVEQTDQGFSRFLVGQFSIPQPW